MNLTLVFDRYQESKSERLEEESKGAPDKEIFEERQDDEQPRVQLTWKDLEWLWDEHDIAVADILATPGLENFELISEDSDEE